MTENDYFVTHSGGCCICDSISRKLEDGSFEHLSYEEIVNRLNEQHEQIQSLQSANAEMEDYLARLEEENQRLLSANTRLAEENTNILQTIRQAYQSERTALGRSVLKQLIENFEGE